MADSRDEASPTSLQPAPTGHDGTGGWAVIVPVKVLTDAKSRLVLPSAARETVALALVTDTLAALAGTPSVVNLLVVTNDGAVAQVADRLQARVLPEPSAAPAGVSSLNAAVLAGLREVQGAAGTAVVLGDLPALRPLDVGLLLDAVTARGRAVVVPDAEGTGSTALVAPAGVPVPSPAFGPGSAAAHVRHGAEPAPWAPARLRQDVDRLWDLALAQELGVGTATTAALASLPPHHWWRATAMADDGAAGGASPTTAALLLEDGRRIAPSAVPRDVLHFPVRPGQRLLVALEDATAAVLAVAQP